MSTGARTESAGTATPSSDRYRIDGRVQDLTRRVLVMGIVNVTPDSFSDGGRYRDPEAAVRHGLALAAEGADLLDVGGESTRPGAEPVPAAEEIARIRPVVERLARETGVPISIDTTKPEVARVALDHGARLVNDVTGLRERDPNGRSPLAALATEHDASLVVMHMRGEPRTMQADPRYDDVVREVGDFLVAAAEHAEACGVAPDRIAVDPGIGFGKTLEHNLALLRRLDELVARGRPVLIGVSRKSMFHKLLGLAVEERLEAGLAATVAAVLRGARLVRVHDVGPTVRALRTVEALL